MGKKKIEVIYYELLETCFSKEDRNEIDEMILNGRFNVNRFIDKVLNGINKVSKEGYRFIGFVSDENADYLAFIEDQKYLYDFHVIKLKDKDNYHCTIRFNNVDPINNVYAVGYPITNKQKEYYEAIGKMPFIDGKVTQAFTEWEEKNK